MTTVLVIISSYILFTRPSFAIFILIGIEILYLNQMVTLPIAGNTTSLIKVFGFFGLITFITSRAILKLKVDLGQTLQTAFLLVLFLIILVSSTRTIAEHEFGFILTRIALKFILYIMAINLLSDVNRLRTYLNLFSVFVAINAVIALYQGFILAYIRPMGGTHNPIAMGFFANIGVVTFLLLFLNEKSDRRKIAYLCGLALVFSTVLISNSRGAMLTFVTIPSIILIRSKISLKFYAIILAVAILLMSFFPAVYTDRFSEFVSKIGENETESLKKDVRWHLTMCCLEIIQDRPITGIGIYNFKLHYKNTYAPANKSWETGIEAHNGFLLIFAELGVFGFLALIGYITVTIWFFRKNEKLFKKYKDKELLMLNTIFEYSFYCLLIFGFFEDLIPINLFYIIPPVAGILYVKGKTLAKNGNLANNIITSNTSDDSKQPKLEIT